MPMTVAEKIDALQKAYHWHNVASILYQAAAAADEAPNLLAGVTSPLSEAQALLDAAKTAAPAAADVALIAKADEAVAQEIALLQAAIAP